MRPCTDATTLYVLVTILKISHIHVRNERDVRVWVSYLHDVVYIMVRGEKEEEG